MGDEKLFVREKEKTVEIISNKNVYLIKYEQ